MGVRFVIASLVLALVGSSHGDGVPRDLSFIKAMIEPYASCTIGKLSCSKDCKKIELCLGDELEVVKECKGTTMCDSLTMTCKEVAEAECSAVDPDVFPCHGSVGGLFPNPFDCHSYFDCGDLSATPAPVTTTSGPSGTKRTEEFSLRVGVGNKYYCEPSTTAYDALSTTCRFRDDHRVCRDMPVPACNTPLQAGPLIENPNIYYVCVSVNGSLQPWLAKCKDMTEVFEDGQCVPYKLRR